MQQQGAMAMQAQKLMVGWSNFNAANSTGGDTGVLPARWRHAVWAAPWA